MTRSPDQPIDYLQPPLGYLLRLPCGDDAADSPLDEPARDRAEQAAAFLRYERIGRIFAHENEAAMETAEIVWLSCSPEFTDQVNVGGAALTEFLRFLLDPNRGLPCVLVTSQAGIECALEGLGVSLSNLAGDADASTGANACEEIVAPGGIISLHVIAGEGACGPQIIPRARHMIINFSFTDLERTVAWGKSETLLIEKPQPSREPDHAASGAASGA